MQVDLNDLVKAKFSPLIESMLFIVVEAISHLDNLNREKSSSNTEVNTLEYVKESFDEKLKKV